METGNPSTEEKLLESFRQFRKVNWHHRSTSDCKPSEIMVLFCIYRKIGMDSLGMKVSEISELLNVTSPGVTQLIKGLEENGMVERKMDQKDRRVVRVRLTEKGKSVTQKAADAFRQSFDGLVEYLGEEQSDQLAELLFKVFDYFKKKETDPTAARSGDDRP
ncbi:MAG TPA: MarR family transcriptional regulator [Bacillales bacterium]|nr:MarR family transcriptional regulator [Bacillales bacterium]